MARTWKERYDSFSARSQQELAKRNAQIAQLETEKTQVTEASRAAAAELEQLKVELTKVQTPSGNDDSRTKALEEAKATLEASVAELTAKVTALEASASTTVAMSVEPTVEQQAQLVSTR